MLRKLLDFGSWAARVAACAALLAGAQGSLAQGVLDTSPVSSAARPPMTQLAAAPPSRDWTEWALALSVLSLIGVVFLVVTRPKPRHRSSSSSLASATTTRLVGATDELTPGQFKEVQKMIAKALANQGAPVTNQAAAVQDQSKPLASRPTSRTTASALPEASVAAPTPPAAPAAVETAVPEVPTEQPAAPPAPAPAPVGPRRAYVSSAPVNGRFRRNVLQGQPAHNSIYELTWDPAQPDQTTFQVNPAVASHPRHISSYADVLEPACEFNLPHGVASRIVTEAPGLLRRVDGDDWEIVRKARIYFA